MTNARWQSTASRSPCIQAGTGSKKATKYSRNGVTALRAPDDQYLMAEHGQSPDLHTGRRRVEKSDKIFTRWRGGLQGPEGPMPDSGERPMAHPVRRRAAGRKKTQEIHAMEAPNGYNLLYAPILWIARSLNFGEIASERAIPGLLPLHSQRAILETLERASDLEFTRSLF